MNERKMEMGMISLNDMVDVLKSKGFNKASIDCLQESWDSACDGMESDKDFREKLVAATANRMRLIISNALDIDVHLIEFQEVFQIAFKEIITVDESEGIGKVNYTAISEPLPKHKTIDSFNTEIYWECYLNYMSKISAFPWKYMKNTVSITEEGEFYTVQFSVTEDEDFGGSDL